MHTLMIINPGHFHAALVLREKHAQLNDDIFVYSQEGPDLDRFIQMAESFNSRADNPTSWKLNVVTGNDFITKAIAEKKADIAILAGRNNTKIEHICALSEAGINVLADKPMVTEKSGLEYLERSLKSEALVMDIMTERYEVTSMVQKELINIPEIFGEFASDEGSPIIYKDSVHHLYKTVNGAPLVRPPWYFDVGVQGEGIIDVTTHLVDVIQWMISDKQALEYSKDVTLLSAGRWSTEVPIEKFQQITKEEQFPAEISEHVVGDYLHYFSNGEFRYDLKGIPVHLKVVWNLEAPEGGGDTHTSCMRGTNADLILEQGPQTGFKVELKVKAHGDKGALKSSLEVALAESAVKGMSLKDEDTGFHVEIPDSARTSHEEHFAQVLNEFVDYLDGNRDPGPLRENLSCKYRLLSEARELAFANPK